MRDNDAVPLPVALPIPFRKILLRILLWSLGIAAACGAIAVLSGGWHTVSRVMATAMLTAGASLLLLGAGYLVDRPLTRPAGLLGMSAVVVEYLLSLALIWQSDDLDMALTITFIAAPVIPAMIFLTMAGKAQTRIAGRVGVACCLLVGMLLLGGVWLDEYPWDDNTWYTLAGAIGTFFPVAVMCLVGAGTDRRYWRWIGVVASVLACGRFFYELESSPRSHARLKRIAFREEHGI